MAKSRSVGTKLLIGAAPSSGTDTRPVVGGVKSIGGIEISQETTDVTAMDSTSGYREYLGGFKDGGEVSISGFLDGADDGQEELYDLLASGDVEDFEIKFPTAIGKSWTFKGVVTKFATSEDVDNAITFDATIKVSGAPALSAG